MERQIKYSLDHEPADFLEDLAPERNIGECVEEVGDHLPNEGQKDQEGQILR